MAIFNRFVAVGLKYQDTVAHGEVSGKSLYFSFEVLHNSVGVVNLVDRELKTDGALRGQQLRKSVARFVVGDVLANDNHWNEKVGYEEMDLRPIKQR